MEEPPVGVRGNLSHRGPGGAIRRSLDRTKHLDLGEREVETCSGWGREEASRFFSLAPRESRSSHQVSSGRLVRHRAKVGDRIILGDQLSRGQIVGDLTHRNRHDHGEADGELSLAVLGDGIGDNLTPDETAALLGGDLKEVLHFVDHRRLGSPCDARSHQVREEADAE